LVPALPTARIEAPTGYCRNAVQTTAEVAHGQSMGRGAHCHVSVATEIERGQAGEHGKVRGREGALQVEATHVQAHEGPVGSADLPREVAPVCEHLALLGITRLPVRAYHCRASAAAAAPQQGQQHARCSPAFQKAGLACSISINVGHRFLEKAL
jgi:hypothetical protein